MPGLALVTSDYYIDPLIPKLKAGTPPSLTTGEQRWYIQQILDLCCSDSKFAEKAYTAILLVLAAGVDEVTPTPPVPSVVTSIVPVSVAVGDPDFILVVHGTGFTATSVIYIRGVSAPTTFVSATEVSTPIDMALVVTPGVAAVMVIDNGLASNAMDITVTAPLVP
jgi:hypothetical protein